MKTKMNFVFKLSSTLVVAAATTLAFADMIIPMNEMDATGKATPIGNVTLKETKGGVLFVPNLAGLPPGLHGFHVHGHADCGTATSPEGVVTIAGAAGGHWDPENTGNHAGPYGEGHLGDLPGLVVAADGRATTEVLAPRIKDLKKVQRLALMIHAHGDNFSDSPAKLGGGGARIACGVIG